MRNMIPLIVALALTLGGCATPGAGTVTPNTQGAQNIGGSQGQATAAETSSASGRITPLVVNALAAKRVTVSIADGKPDVNVEAHEDAEITVNGGAWGFMTLEDTRNDNEISSGGGAAGGTGGAARAGSGGQTSGGTSGASSVQGGGSSPSITPAVTPAPTPPATGGGGQ